MTGLYVGLCFIEAGILYGLYMIVRAGWRRSLDDWLREAVFMAHRATGAGALYVAGITAVLWLRVRALR